MTSSSLPPDQILPLGEEARITFDCHPGVSCFTECCRELDLLLSPYDCLRLKNHLGLHSSAFLEQYVLIAWDERVVFPQCYLTMVDDGRASCVFVEKSGCRVYPDRPAACRAYPVGRGVGHDPDGKLREQFVLLREPHCQGFSAGEEQEARNYLHAQGLEQYNRFNDALLDLTRHERIRGGFRPDHGQLSQYILALYDLDSFRRRLSEGSLSMNRPLSPLELAALAGDDEELLLLGMRWLQQEWFAR